MDKNFLNKKNIIFKLFIIFLISFLLFVYVFPWRSYGINIPFSWKDYKLWLDLQWWIELDYKVDFEQLKKEEWENFDKQREKDIIENLKSIIDKRVESLWINDSELNDASYWDEKHIIVQIPLKWTNSEENLKNINLAKKAIWNVVKVSFKEQRSWEISPEDLKKREQIAKNLLEELKSWENFAVLQNKYKLNFEKVESWTLSTKWASFLTEDEKNNLDKILNQNNFLKWNFYNWIKNILENSLWKNKKDLVESIQKLSLNISEERKETLKTEENFSSEELSFLNEILNILTNNFNSKLEKYFKENKNLKPLELNEVKIDSVEAFLIFENDESWDKKYIFINKKPSIWVNIVSKDWKILDDKYLIKANVWADQIWKPVIVLNFNDEGAKIFYEATQRLVWKPIAIFVWWELVTAPNVNQPIAGWQATITWDYSPQSAKKSAENINAWLVPAPIYLTSEKTIDSKIWTEALDKLLIAGFAWFILIFIFLIVIYKISWFMAFLALVIYAIIVLAVVKLLSIVLTLASIAWLILSVWMAIDANILIFERIKWELKDWKKLDDSLKIWFKNSWSAIWDSNITWLLVAIILFIFGINLIKWFWIMLWIWIIVSLFTAMYVSRIFVTFVAMNIKNKDLFIWLKDKNIKK